MPIEVLVPKKTNNPIQTYNVSGDLIKGYFDHLFVSLHSAPSIDQLGHGGRVHTGIGK